MKGSLLPVPDEVVLETGNSALWWLPCQATGSAGPGGPGDSVLKQGKAVSLVFNFYLIVAARTIF